MAKQVLTTTIEATNERGVKFNGTWHNYSSYAKDGDIDRTVQAGDKAEVELTSTGWIRKLRVLERAAPNGGTAPAGARQLDAAQYARLRAVEIAATAAVQFSEDFEAYMQNLNALANWIVAYIEGGDPLG
jgi:hypothetical protein